MEPARSREMRSFSTCFGRLLDLWASRFLSVSGPGLIGPWTVTEMGRLLDEFVATYGDRPRVEHAKAALERWSAVTELVEIAAHEPLNQTIANLLWAHRAEADDLESEIVNRLTRPNPGDRPSATPVSRV